MHGQQMPERTPGREERPVKKYAYMQLHRQGQEFVEDLHALEVTLRELKMTDWPVPKYVHFLDGLMPISNMERRSGMGCAGFLTKPCYLLKTVLEVSALVGS